MKINQELKLKLIKVYLLFLAIFILFWWPLSHWFYSDFYHQLLGFPLGSYQDNLVKIIGVCGIFPVLLAYFAALDPIKNRDCIKILIISSFAIALTFLYLILKGEFPVREYLNVGMSFLSGIILLLIMPDKEK